MCVCRWFDGSVDRRIIPGRKGVAVAGKGELSSGWWWGRGVVTVLWESGFPFANKLSLCLALRRLIFRTEANQILVERWREETRMGCPLIIYLYIYVASSPSKLRHFLQGAGQ